MLKYMLSRILYNEISKYMNSKNRIKRRNENMRNWSEEHYKEEAMVQAFNENKLFTKINLTNDFLNEVVKLEKLAEEKTEFIQEFFEHHGTTKNNGSLYLTTPQKEELKKLLSLRPVDYVSYKSGNLLNEASTMEFIIENTNVFKSLKKQMSHKTYILWVDAKSPTIRFNIRLDRKL